MAKHHNMTTWHLHDPQQDCTPALFPSLFYIIILGAYHNLKARNNPLTRPTSQLGRVGWGEATVWSRYLPKMADFELFLTARKIVYPTAAPTPVRTLAFIPSEGIPE